MRKVYWILEQSLNSFPWHMPVLRQDQENGIVGGLAWQRRFVWMGQFGHELWKRTELVGLIPPLDLSFPTAPAKTKRLFGLQHMAQQTGRPSLFWEAGAEGHGALSTPHFAE